MKKDIDRVYLIGNGQQAPYGIGEIIAIIPLSHWRKIQAYMRRYYNPPSMRLNSWDGKELDFVYEGMKVIGIGYSMYQ